MRSLTHQGYLVEEQGMAYLGDTNPEVTIVIAKVLIPLGASTRAPPRSPAQRFDRFHAPLIPHRPRFCNSAEIPLGLRSYEPPIGP